MFNSFGGLKNMSSKFYTMLLDGKVHKKLKEKSFRESKPISGMIREAIDCYILKNPSGCRKSGDVLDSKQA